MEWSYTRTDELAKLIPFQPGKRITLQDAREMEPRLAQREKTEEETRELLALAGQLEGLARNVGMHAGGVLIAPGKLTDFCPLYAAQGTESTISQFDMKDVERIGLVKFDFLGLTTLTVLDWAVQSIRAMGKPDFLAREDPARRSGRLRGVRPRQHHRDIPVRIARHARSRQAARGPTASRTSSRSSRSTVPGRWSSSPSSSSARTASVSNTSIHAWSRS